MENTGEEYNEDSFTSNSPTRSSVKTVASTDFPSETGQITPICDRSDPYSLSETENGTKACSKSVEETLSLDTSKSKPDLHEASDSTCIRHRLGFTPPLERPKDPSMSSLGIIQELRKDGFLSCSTPLIPRNTRQTKSGISFEYYFRPNRTTPRVLPRLKSDGNIGKTLGQRNETSRRESPLRKNTFKMKSPTKSLRWHTGCRAAMERRRLQREAAEKRSNQSRDDWKVIGQFWQDLRQRKERERRENEERRIRERKILNELMGRSSEDALP